MSKHEMWFIYGHPTSHWEFWKPRRALWIDDHPPNVGQVALCHVTAPTCEKSEGLNFLALLAYQKITLPDEGFLMFFGHPLVQMKKTWLAY